MNPNFYELHIGQVVWVNGKSEEIKYLKDYGNKQEINFIGNAGITGQNYDELNISLTEPKSKMQIKTCKTCKSFMEYDSKYLDTRTGKWKEVTQCYVESIINQGSDFSCCKWEGKE